MTAILPKLWYKAQIGRHEGKLMCPEDNIGTAGLATFSVAPNGYTKDKGLK